jgi:hypothetical protein
MRRRIGNPELDRDDIEKRRLTKVDMQAAKVVADMKLNSIATRLHLLLAEKRSRTSAVDACLRFRDPSEIALAVASIEHDSDSGRRPSMRQI